MTVGGNLSAAAGPIGTGGSIQSAIAHPAPVFSYSKSKGECREERCDQWGGETRMFFPFVPFPLLYLLSFKSCHSPYHSLTVPPTFLDSRSPTGLYAGVSLEGTVIVERKDANREFYGQPIPALDLLTGKVPAPEAATAMYDVIEAVSLKLA